MPPPPAAVPELDDPLDPSSAGGGGGWGTEEVMVATAVGGAGGGSTKDSEHHRGETFNVGLSSPPLTSPAALLGSADGGFAAAGAAEGRQDGGHVHAQPGGAAEFRREKSRSPPADMLLSSGSPTSRSPEGGGRSGGGPSVFGEVSQKLCAGEVVIPARFRVCYSTVQGIGVVCVYYGRYARGELVLDDLEVS